MIHRRTTRRGRTLRVALFVGLAAYGAWKGLIFIAWLGFAFAVAELPRDDRHRAVLASLAFLIGGLILVGEVFAWASIDVGAAIALGAGVLLAGMGAMLLVRIGQRGG